MSALHSSQLDWSRAFRAGSSVEWQTLRTGAHSRRTVDTVQLYAKKVAEQSIDSRNRGCVWCVCGVCVCVLPTEVTS